MSNRIEKNPPPPPRYLISIKEAAKALGLGRSKTYQLIQEQKLATVTIGRRHLVRLDSVQAMARGEGAR
jgi:excisionase family DNA binding protein